MLTGWQKCRRRQKKRKRRFAMVKKGKALQLSLFCVWGGVFFVSAAARDSPAMRFGLDFCGGQGHIYGYEQSI